jgi:hypothetical protein
MLLSDNDLTNLGKETLACASEDFDDLAFGEKS